MIVKVKNRYKDYLKTREGVEAYNNFKQILYSDEDTLTETLCREYIRQLEFPEMISVCDVGGGDGKRIIKLSKCLTSLFEAKIKLDFIEQSQLMCEDFEKRQNEISDICEVNIYPKEIEHVELKNNYDLVFFVHSIFCLSNFNAFKKVYERVNPGGIMVVVSNSENSLLSNLKRELDLDYEDSRYEISNLIKDLNENKIGFSSTVFETKWMVQETEINEKIEIILEWLSLGEYPDFDFFKQSRLIDFAKKFTVRDHGQYLFSEIEKVLLIRK